jgi:hypothetical protein
VRLTAAGDSTPPPQGVRANRPNPWLLPSTEVRVSEATLQAVEAGNEVREQIGSEGTWPLEVVADEDGPSLRWAVAHQDHQRPDHHGGHHDP